MGIFSYEKIDGKPKFDVGEMVMIRWRGQVGMIQEYDRKIDKYLVKPIDKGYVEFYDESELDRNY
ncbi:hypothetical protein [Helcococcus kunzii]|uniref:hypothetical protein n=1 Tax=Helcococcus kunzii TaxID=40091 RepID=UPI0021A3B392|nr:hypothetical protein [Helcococcus kunzii]MCT1796460.1 hypothetical protein [Helcococcus kunzii]MCT1989063.1 hypothetical protein [Helcococcus kunzii]